MVRVAGAVRITGLGESLAVATFVLAFGLVWAAMENAANAEQREPYPAVVPTSFEAEDDPPLPEAREWLVDGYNVLHAGLLGGEGERANWWTATARDRVLAQGLAFVRSAPGGPVEVWVVFDGPDPAEVSAPGCAALHTVFAPSADEWLVERVRNASDPTVLAVVTGDRQVGDRARHRGAHVVSPRDWLASCRSEVAS